MLKNRFHISVALLAGLMGLSACVGEVETEVFEINPTYDGNSILAQFYMQVPQMSDARMGRMSADNTQQNQYFRGIGDVYMYPFAAAQPGTLQGSEYVADNWISLKWDELEPLDGNQPKWKLDIRLPISTNHFLVYARAKHTGNRFAEGSTGTSLSKLVPEQSPALTHTVKDITFTPQLVTTKEAFDQVAGKASWSMHIFNQVAAANGKADGYTYYWHEEPSYFGVDELGVLYQCYQDFTGHVGGRIVNGSSQNMLELLTDLYKKVNVKDLTGSWWGREKRQYNAVKNAVKTAITTPVDGVQLAWQTDRLVFANGTNPNIPECLNLPNGAFKLKAVENSAPMRLTMSTSANIDVTHKEAWDVYAYPAELFYCSSSVLGCSNQKQMAQAGSYSSWKDFVNDVKRFNESEVSPYTRCCVVKSPLQYGMANLVTKVKLAANPLNIQNNQLYLSGVLVRGQREVGWNFTRQPIGLSGVPYVVYDKDINGSEVAGIDGKVIPVPGGNAAGTASAANYTLLYPTQGVQGTLAQDNTEKVKLWLEFVNKTGKTITGKDGCQILNNAKFYIGATLDLFTANAGRPSAEVRHRMLESDYLTKVTLSISNFNGATDYIPDVDLSSTEVGVSVDIEWEPGFTFKDVEVQH